MSLTSRYIAPLLVSAGAVAAIAVAPNAAAADPALPQPGSEDASATISDLESRGYDVRVQYTNGLPDVELNQCWVNTINTADAAAGGLRTVYIDVECPK
jgi:hypothetical protein